MEKLDREILEILTGDSRYSAAKIAVMLGESEEKVAEAIKRMERDGTIVKYAAVIDNEAASDEFVEAFIEVKVTPQRGTGFDAVAEEIAACEEVRRADRCAASPASSPSAFRRMSASSARRRILF